MQNEYILGINDTELERLRFQHGVWKNVTDDLFRRVGVTSGWHCLDVGAGPGFVSIDLRKRVGDSGSITALEPSTYYLDHLRHIALENNWSNIDYITGTAESASLPNAMYDMIFIRWVIGFVPDPKRFLDNLIPALKPGGVIVIQDYLYDGLALYPRGGAFDNAKDIVIRHWASGGGDAYIASRIPQFFRDAGLALIDYSPHCLAGDPESPVFEWAERFFTKHMDLMVESGATDKTTADAIIEDWYAHKSNPNAIFCSPIVVDMVGRKPIVEV